MKTLRNYFYSASYQLLTILLPIITVPIISRALGSTEVGVYAYTNSIVQEFTLVGTYGLFLGFGVSLFYQQYRYYRL